MNTVSRKQTPVRISIYRILLVSVFMLIMGCDRSPQEIRIGQQECDHCWMIISQEPFAAQLITQQGRQYAFDAIECLAAFLDSDDGMELDIHSLWVPDFMNPGNWIAAESAWYLQSDGLRSPMTLNFSAYSEEGVARSQQTRFGGQIIRWLEVRDIVKGSWSEGIHSHSHHH